MPIALTAIVKAAFEVVVYIHRRAEYIYVYIYEGLNMIPTADFSFAVPFRYPSCILPISFRRAVKVAMRFRVWQRAA